MTHWHCDDCHHEWDGSLRDKCDWCGSPGHVLKDRPSPAWRPSMSLLLAVSNFRSENT